MLSESCGCYPQFPQENTEIIPQIRPRLLPSPAFSNSLLIHHPIFDTSIANRHSQLFKRKCATAVYFDHRRGTVTVLNETCWWPRYYCTSCNKCLKLHFRSASFSVVFLPFVAVEEWGQGGKWSRTSHRSQNVC